MLSGFIIVIAGLLTAYLAFSHRLANSSNWKATVTPLASIMGSGFLVSAPLLGGTVGNYALVSMAVMLAFAFAVGSAIRFNIRHFEPIEREGHGPAQVIGFLSRIALVGSYFITVSYYLQLLAAFLLNAFGVTDQILSHGITTVLLVVIGLVGMWRGLGMLENVEKHAIALNLGVIASLLFGLAVYNAQLVASGEWALPALPRSIDWNDIRVVLGLLIVVQGFETSRYLGDTHPAEQRIKTMRAAQIISSVIYLLFISLTTVLFHEGLDADVTAIVRMTMPVAVVLPVLLSLAAIGSQFSASVADAEGAGGLIEDITQKRVRIRYAYLIILVTTVTLTWLTNVQRIIAYASRAFAFYYALQCAIALVVAWQKDDLRWRWLWVAGFAVLTIGCLLVFVFGIPAG